MIEMSSYVKLHIGILKNNLEMEEMEEGLGCGWQLAASTSRCEWITWWLCPSHPGTLVDILHLGWFMFGMFMIALTEDPMRKWST